VFSIFCTALSYKSPLLLWRPGETQQAKAPGVACKHGRACDVPKITMSRWRTMKSYRKFEIESWEGNNQFEHGPVRSWSQTWTEMLQSVQLTENPCCIMPCTGCDMICFLIYPLRIAASTLQQCQQACIIWDPFKVYSIRFGSEGPTL
jgi:hypothetical protein